MTIFYNYGDKLYVNITNRCSCDCVFCIRRSGDSVGNADSLWLEHEPSVEEIKYAFNSQNLHGTTEIVFCGYGEPLERADVVVEIAEYIKSKSNLPLRLNTNGLVKLLFPEFKLNRLCLFDSISISLNADNASDYQKLTRSVFGEVSFEYLLSFAKETKAFTQVFLSIVDVPNPELNIEKCKVLSDKLNIPLRVRVYGM